MFFAYIVHHQSRRISVNSVYLPTLRSHSSELLAAVYRLCQFRLITCQQGDIVPGSRVIMRQPQADAAGTAGYIDTLFHRELPPTVLAPSAIFASSDLTIKSTRAFIIKSGR